MAYHEYKSIWLNLVIQLEELLCEQKTGNAHDAHAVAICKTIDWKINVGRAKEKWQKNLANYGYYLPNSSKFYCTISWGIVLVWHPPYVIILIEIIGRKKHWRIECHQPNPSMFSTAKSFALCM